MYERGRKVAKIKLVLCDIDDTLVHKELHLSERVIQTIRKVQQEGIFFSLATGRMPYRAQNFAEEAGLTTPYIANNGSILYDRGKYVYAQKVYAGQFKDLFRQYMESHPDFTVIFSYDDRERPLVTTKWIAAREHKYKGYNEPLGNTDEVWDQEVHKVYIVDDARTGIIGEIADCLRAMNGNFSFFQYQQYSMEIVASGCSKASGLVSLLEHLGITKEEVMAIGDHTNDMEVIQMAGIGVAVANAQEELKAVADYVTRGERAEGVIEAIETFVLQS